MKIPPKRILVVRTDRIGDVILSTPVIKNLKSAYPNAYIVFMCRPYTKDVLEGNPYLDEVIVYDKYGRHKSLLSSIAFSFYLRKKHFDWAVILHPTNRVHLTTFFAAIPFRVGWDRKMGFFLSKRIFHHKQLGKKHELEYTLDILRALGIPIMHKDTYFPLKDESNVKVGVLLRDKGISDRDNFLAIHPLASCPSKRWPQDYFIKVVRILKKEIGIKIVVVSSKDEMALSDDIAKEDVIDLRGKLNISELGSLIKRSSLFLSNDSGPVHIAWTLGVPVISIFGRKDPGLSPR